MQHHVVVLHGDKLEARPDVIRFQKRMIGDGLVPQGTLDTPEVRFDGLRMAKRTPVQLAKETPSKGAVLAAKYRARANGLSAEERLRHRAGAMSLIYGNPAGQQVHARSR